MDNQITNISEEINILKIFGTLKRNKLLCVLITSSTLFLAGIYVSVKRPTWKGQFDIVLTEEKNSLSNLNQLVSNSGLAQLAGLSPKKSNLNTQLEILKSSSILQPVYDYVKSEKKKLGEDVSSWDYENWVKGNFTIRLKKNTAVLSLEYLDKQKNLILPVLNKISNKYQDYSIKDRSIELKQGVKYLEDQVENLKKISNTSMREAQEFAINNDLNLQDGMPIYSTKEGSTVREQSLNEKKINYKKEIKFFQNIIDKYEISNLEERINLLNQFSLDTPTNKKLQELRRNLALKKAIYMPNDPTIIDLERKILSLKKSNNEDTFKSLKSQKKVIEFKLSLLERPKDIILKHKELLRNALRNEKTLSLLENELQALRLEKARQEKPWQLISLPTIKPDPVSPRKKRILAFGLLGGIILSIALSTLKEKTKGILYNRDEIEVQLDIPLLKVLKTINYEIWDQAINLLSSGILDLNRKDISIGLIKLGEISDDIIENFKSRLERVLNNQKLIITDNLSESSKCDIQILLIAQGGTTNKQINNFNQLHNLQNKPLAGWIYFETI